ncbi:MAG: BtaA family protein [Candidatus Sumerlaeaceae bacterium]|nr:BtaA family protein [Candidatus Sumerlaeaceae bacterium]
MSFLDWLGGQGFRLVHGNNLVYNTCWEDPRLDRVALDLGPEDTVLVITSAGCNALDYALCGPSHVFAVDMNPRQNALLELKLAAIRTLDYDEFFRMFGEGRLDEGRALYRSRIRADLPPAAREYWDRKIRYFGVDSRGKGFYFHGTTGLFARLMNFYIDRVARIRPGIDALMAAQTVDEQREIYDTVLRDAFWTRFMRWLMGRGTTLSLVGVPRPQIQQVERHYGGIVHFIEECVEAVFARLPFQDNYFWRVYLTGHYTRDCCPEYLTAEGFARLKAGLGGRISVHTNTVQGFLEQNEIQVSRFVLLDHMDWLSTRGRHLLQGEWQAIVRRAAPGARVIWRSGALRVDFVDPLRVRTARGEAQVGELLTYHHDLAANLHARDRVHTYGSFYIADLATA